MNYHIGQIRGGNIKICDSIPPEYKARYRHAIQQYFFRKQMLIEQKTQMNSDMQKHNNSATEKYEKVGRLDSTEQNWKELKRVQTTTRNK